jgi:hypothetical protein
MRQGASWSWGPPESYEIALYGVLEYPVRVCVWCDGERANKNGPEPKSPAP